MQLFIDTAILKEIEWGIERGLVDGVTTNPTLLNKADRKLGDVVNDILEVVSDKPVSIQIMSQTADEIIEEAKTVAKLGKNVVIKLPMTDEGMMAVRELSAKGIKTNVTLVFSVSQALLAARAGATYVSAFDGTLQNVGDAQFATLEQMLHALKQSDSATQLILGAIHDVSQVERAAVAGVPIASIPFKVLVQMYRHDQTDKGEKKFLEEWDKIPK